MVTVNPIRTLKGAPLSVLSVIVISGEPVTQKFCERYSGYSDKPVRQALYLLEELGIISHNEDNTWQVISYADQPLTTLAEA